MNERDLQKELEEGIYKARSLLKVIKLKCMDCCCGVWKEVQQCPAKDTCFLHPYRLGKNPLKKRNYSPEALQELRLRAQRNLGRYTPTSKD